MPSDDPTTPADLFDRHRRYLALAVLFMGVSFASGASLHVVGESAHVYLDGIELAAALLAVGFLAPTLWWKARNLNEDTRSLYFSPEGFVAETMRRAYRASFETTVIALMFGAFLGDELFEGLPPDFFFRAVLAVMFVVFSVAFLVLESSASSSDAGPGEGALDA